VPVTASQLLQTRNYAYERKDVHVDLSNNTFLHCSVVQVRNVSRVDCDILLGVSMVSIASSHLGGYDTSLVRIEKTGGMDD
jgi:hypothetical protein